LTAKSDKHWTAVHFASQEGRINILEFLHLQQMPLDAPDVNGTRPLHLAVMGGHLVVVEFLLNNGARVSSERCYYSPLHFAAMFGRENVIALLLQRGADLEAVQQEGGTR